MTQYTIIDDTTGRVLYRADQEHAPTSVPGVTTVIEGWVTPTPTLDMARADKLAEMKARRDAIIFGGMTWDGSRFDTDEVSQARMLGAHISGQPRTWRLADNTWRNLSAAEIGAVWLALDAHVQDAFAVFAVKEAQILAAETAEAVAAVTWA